MVGVVKTYEPAALVVIVLVLTFLGVLALTGSVRFHASFVGHMLHWCGGCGG